MTKNEALKCRCRSERVELPFSDVWVSEGIEKLCGSDGIISSPIPGREEDDQEDREKNVIPSASQRRNRNSL